MKLISVILFASSVLSGIVIENQICPEENAPVCGKDSETYSNSCYMKIAGKELAYKGECIPCTSRTVKSICAKQTKPLLKCADMNCPVNEVVTGNSCETVICSLSTNCIYEKTSITARCIEK